MTLQVSTPLEEGVYQGSKWLKIQVLCDANELASLFSDISPFWIFPLTGIVDGSPIEPSSFLSEYGAWIEGLKKGEIPSDAAFKRILAASFTEDLEALWLQRVSKGFLMKIRKPVVQVQTHFFSYSSLDGVFRPMSVGPSSVFWGLQFSFPQLYQDPRTMEFIEIKEAPLFRKIQLWARETTRATPFIVGEKKINSPIRIGKNCFSWISHHPQLIAQGISVHGA